MVTQTLNLLCAASFFSLPNRLLTRSPSTCNSVPSAMSPPFTAVESPFSPSSSDVNDDLNSESEILLALCQKTLVDVDFVTASMKSCIFDGHSALNRNFFWCNGTETSFRVGLTPSESGFGGSDLHHFDSDAIQHESMVPETEFDVEPLPESEFDLESEVPETQFEELSAPLFEMRDAKKRKVSGGGYGGTTSEPTSLKAEEREP